MRCCGAGGPQPDKEEVRANKNIAKQLKKDQEDFENEMKLLLLGNYYGLKNDTIIRACNKLKQCAIFSTNAAHRFIK
jgi:hypothetical protein